MVDHEPMISLISLMTGLGAFGLLALRYGADSRRDERNL